MDAARLIAFLNAIKVGEMDSLLAKLGEGRQACLTLEHPELAELLEEASASLRKGDLRVYRKRLATVIARLGHVRSAS